MRHQRQADFNWTDELISITVGLVGEDKEDWREEKGTAASSVAINIDFDSWRDFDLSLTVFC